jgi:hypothetical protein
MPEAPGLKNKTHMIFCSLPVSHKYIVVGNVYVAHTLGLTLQQKIRYFENKDV